MTKLTQDQKESLADMADSGEWNAVLALAAICVENHQNRVLTTDISKTDREILLAKAKLEGALEMQRLLQNVREHTGLKKKT